MKKLFFIAAIAGAALVSCTKNELAPSATQQNEITFSTPVVGSVTKALIADNEYPSTESFGVYAWHSSVDAAYMNEVKVSHDASLQDDNDGETEEAGGWKPATSYYWPKTGTLVFDAFSPYSVNTKVTATKASGITITDYIVEPSSTDVDLLYATRTTPKTSSSDDEDTEDTKYDGVDIVFNHALSAVKISAKTQDTYTGCSIVITSIKVSANNTATFNQNVGSSAAWGTTTNSVDYTYTAPGSALTMTPTDCGTQILLPQNFTESEAKIVIGYTIQNGSETPLAQSITFNLKDGYKDTSSNTISAWKMGKRYSYSIVFTLNEIFFEPSVSIWTEVPMAGMEI